MNPDGTDTLPEPTDLEPATPSRPPLVVGDQVHLRGGQSWNMTVVEVKGNRLKCAWHDRNGAPMAADYPEQALCRQGE